MSYTTKTETKDSLKATLAKIGETKVIKITFPYDVQMLHNIRSLIGRQWHAPAKCWSAPLYADNIKQLQSWGFTIDPRLLQFVQDSELKTQRAAILPIKELKGELYPFQKQGVEFLERTNGRALIADEMGLGKTVQALAWLHIHPENRPAIIVVPASLKLNWKKEAERWLNNPKIEVLQGSNTRKLKGDIIIINYDILHNWLDPLREIDPKVLITDECHYYKSNKAKRTKAVKLLAKAVDHFIALSGTPIVNKPIEAYNALRLINYDLFKNFRHFADRYCNPKWNGFGVSYDGASNTQELHDLLKSTVMIRRLKKDVLPELPEKTRSFFPLQLTNQSEYTKADNDLIQFLRETKGNAAARKAIFAEALTRIEVLKQLAVKGKLEEAISWITDFLEVQDKLVVFATHKFVIDALMEKFSKVAVKIDGSVSLSERNKAVDSFQNNPKVQLFIGNIQAAGVGITLTASSNVAFLELPWTPGALVQAEDRCHRIGQKDNVNIYYLLATDTIEDKIAELLDRKRKTLDAVLDGIETDQESLLTELIKQYQS